MALTSFFLLKQGEEAKTVELAQRGFDVTSLVVWQECRFLDTEVDDSNPGNSMLCPWARRFIRIASVDTAVKWVPGWDNLVRDVQCNELFGGIALKNHAFFIFILFPRQSRSQGGGIATVHKSTLGSNITFKTKFDFSHTSFEVVQASITL